MKAALRARRLFALVPLVPLFCLVPPRPAAAQCEPAKPAEDSKPPAGRSPAKLRYDWQLAAKYQYEVTIEAQLPDRKLTYKGTSTYQVRDVGASQSTLVQTGTLQKNEVMKRQSRGIGPGFQPGFQRHMAFIHRHFPGPHGFATRKPAHELTVDERGGVVKITGDNPLPLLLGDLATLTIEPLPAKGESSWQVANGVLVLQQDGEDTNAFPRGGPLAVTEPATTTRPGDKLANYRIKDVKDDKVTIVKQVHLKTAEQSEGSASFDQEGTGELVFDQKRGVLADGDLKYVNTFSQDNISIKVPVQVHYHLLSEDEVKKRDEEQKARFAKMEQDRAQADAEAAEPLSDAEAQKLIESLADRKTRRNAADTLAKKKRPDGHQQEIARALDPLLSDDDDGSRDASTKALKIWATAENVPALVTVAKTESNVFIRNRAIEILGPLKDERGAEAVAAMFLVARHEAGQSLEQMGPVAEPFVLPLLDTPDEGARIEVCRILAAIGTLKSRAKLEKLALKPRGSDAQAAREALEKIAGR